MHQQTLCWTKNTIKGGFAEPVDKKCKPGCRGKPGLSCCLPAGGLHGVRNPLALEAGHSIAKHSEPLSKGKKSSLLTSSPLHACFQERHWRDRSVCRWKQFTVSLNRSKCPGENRGCVHCWMVLGTDAILSPRPKLLTRTTWRKLSNE